MMRVFLAALFVSAFAPLAHADCISLCAKKYEVGGTSYDKCKDACNGLKPPYERTVDPMVALTQALAHWKELEDSAKEIEARCKGYDPGNEKHPEEVRSKCETLRPLRKRQIDKVKEDLRTLATADVIEIQPPVYFIPRGGAPRDAVVGDLVKPGDSLKAGKAGWARIRLYDGSIVVVRFGDQLSLESPGETRSDYERLRDDFRKAIEKIGKIIDGKPEYKVPYGPTHNVPTDTPRFRKKYPPRQDPRKKAPEKEFPNSM